jgi:XTP/dITP diphosphohydrolase
VKLHEIRGLLRGVPIEIVSLEEWPQLPPPEETGSTFEENARIKARYYAAATRLPAVGEDSGLEIDALDGEPGIHSARFGGEATSYPEKFGLIYREMRARGRPQSAARFVCALALADVQGIAFEARGVVEGCISPEPRGTGGFGYDPIFFYPPFGCTFAEAGDRKSTVSHRARAFEALARHLSVARHRG